MEKSTRRLDGETKWWIGTAILVGLALAGMWQQTSATMAETRERLTAVETVIPRIDAKLKVLEAGQRAMSTLLMERLPK